MKFNDYLKQRGSQTKGTQPNGSSMIPAQGSAAARMVVRELNGSIVAYTDKKETYVTKGYGGNDIVYMIIKAIVDKAIQAPWAVYKVVDEKAYKSAQLLRKSLHNHETQLRYVELMSKALEKYEDDERLNKLLERPNEESTLAKHHATLWTYKLSSGDYYEHWSMPSGGVNEGKPDELNALPSQYMNILTNKKFPLKVTGYKITAGIQQDFTKEEILHEAYVNLEWSVDGAHFYGQSPMKAATRRVQRNNESQAQGAALMRNGGPRGFTYLDMPAEALKDDFKGEMVNEQTNDLKAKHDELMRDGSTVGATAFSGYKVGFTEVGLSAVDLDSVNMEMHDFRMICGSFNFPSIILGDPDSKTYANMTEAYKALILNCVLPLLIDREQAFNHKLHSNAGYKKAGVVISFDLSQYSELEVNKKEQAEYLSLAEWLTLNEKRIIAGEAKSSDPLMDKIYVNQGKVPLEDLGIGETEPINEEDNLDYNK